MSFAAIVVLFSSRCFRRAVVVALLSSCGFRGAVCFVQLWSSSCGHPVVVTRICSCGFARADLLMRICSCGFARANVHCAVIFHRTSQWLLVPRRKHSTQTEKKNVFRMWGGKGPSGAFLLHALKVMGPPFWEDGVVCFHTSCK